MDTDDEVLFRRNAEFGRAWTAGSPPALGGFLAGLAEPLRTRVFGLLLVKDILLRTKSGLPIDRDHYLTAFPEYADTINSALGPASTRPEPDASTTPADGTDRLPSFAGYLTVRPLGAGGQGTVYLVRDTTTGGEFAAKRITAGAGASAVARARFRAEAEITARLQHTGIVRVYGIREGDESPVIILEYVPGNTLQDRYEAERPTPADAARIVADIADAIAYAHANGVCHRDLKPSNVLLTADGRVKVTDFGVARDTLLDRNLTATAAVVGTPGYLAPEAARSAVAADELSDVYSLGAVLYFILTGQPPPVESRPSFPAATPTVLEAVVAQCLDPYPANRYPSARTLAADLRAYTGGLPLENLGRVRRTQFGVRGRVASAVVWAVTFPLVTFGFLFLLGTASDPHRGGLPFVEDMFALYGRDVWSAFDPDAARPTTWVGRWAFVPLLSVIAGLIGLFQPTYAYELWWCVRYLRPTRRPWRDRVSGACQVGLGLASWPALVGLGVVLVLGTLGAQPADANAGQNHPFLVFPGFFLLYLPVVLAGMAAGFMFRQPAAVGGEWLRRRPVEWLAWTTGHALRRTLIAAPVAVLWVRPPLAAWLTSVHIPVDPGGGLSWVVIALWVCLVYEGGRAAGMNRPVTVAAFGEGVRRRFTSPTGVRWVRVVGHAAGLAAGVGFAVWYFGSVIYQRAADFFADQGMADVAPSVLAVYGVVLATWVWLRIVGARGRR